MGRVKEGSRQIFVAHPWREGAQARMFREALDQVGADLNVDFVFPEENFLGTRALEENLSDAALSIFDLSEWTPNLAYELGVANGLNVPTVSLLRKDTESSATPPAFVQGPAEVRYYQFDELADLLTPLIREHMGSFAPSFDVKNSSPTSVPAVDDESALLNREVLEQLRAGDEVGLRELARRERDEFQSKFRSQMQIYARQDDLLGFDAAVTPLLVRCLAWMLPLVDHRSPLFLDELRVMGRFNSVRPVTSGPRRWVSMTNWVTWWLANSLGAFALYVDNVKALGGFFRTPLEEDRSSRRVLATVLPEIGGVELSEARLAEVTDGRYWDPPLHYLARSLGSAEFLSERYPGFVAAEEIVVRLADFNFLGSLLAGKEGELLTASWAAIEDGGKEIARRISSDLDFRESVAWFMRVDPTDLLLFGPSWLEAGFPQSVPGGHVSSEALTHWSR